MASSILYNYINFNILLYLPKLVWGFVTIFRRHVAFKLKMSIFVLFEQ